jgi:hypothetical protein
MSSRWNGPKREFVIKCYLRHILLVVQSEWGKSGKNQTEKEGSDGDVALVKFVGPTNGKNNRQKGNSSLAIVHHNKLLNVILYFFNNIKIEKRGINKGELIDLTEKGIRYFENIRFLIINLFFI